MKLKRNNRQLILYGLPMILLLAASLNEVGAAELSADFSTGIGVTDNIARTNDNTIDETVSTVGMNLDWSETTRKLNASVQIGLTYLNYLDNTFDEELIGGVNMDADFSLLDERLRWTFQDNYGQQLADPLAVSNPGNRENVNFLTTGPRLTLPIGGRNSVGLDLLYSKLNYEVQPFDNESGFVALRLSRAVREDRQLSLNTTARRIKYDNEVLAPDTDILEAFVSYEGDNGRNLYSVELGFTELSVDTGKSDGWLLRVDLRRQVTPFATFSVNGGSQYSIQGDLFRFNQSNAQPIGLTQDIDGLGNAFRNHSVDFIYALNHERTRLNIGLGWRQEDYELGFDRDRDTIRTNISLERDMTRTIFANLRLRVDDRKYKYIDREDTDFLGSVSIGYRFGPAFNVNIEYSYVQRTSLESADESVENRVFLNLTYVPAWTR